jgi:hypothetical protein
MKKTTREMATALANDKKFCAEVDISDLSTDERIDWLEETHNNLDIEQYYEELLKSQISELRRKIGIHSLTDTSLREMLEKNLINLENL